MNIAIRVLSDWLILSAVFAGLLVVATFCLLALDKYEAWRQKRFVARVSSTVIDIETRRLQLNATIARRVIH